ncbi:T-box-containing protein TBX6L-like [Spea bombifrons]|uniref:T-box-containing protein TBX6L-like n=1 Tax=Spea bombifrons TaxID=233779 RepID=UPI002349B3B7|nr:T-box-containing protein TBX6L-like [Spea bombifrons]
MHSRAMLGYSRPAPEPPAPGREMGVSFPPPVGYYLPHQCPPAPSPPPPPVTAELENKELWEKFNAVGTEMILTKSGRRMFPEFSVSLSGLEPHSLYTLCVQAVPDGETRYKWRDGAWSASGRAEPGPPTRLYVHPESPAPGHRWMDRPISFNKVRLTNNTLNQNGQIVLQSMHRYLLRLFVIPTSCHGSHPQAAATIAFPETAFIAVTSYQNPRLSLLKIEENPFAKGIKYFKTQQESYTQRKRVCRPSQSGERSPGSKKSKECAEELRPISRDSTAERQPVTRDSTAERQPVTRDSAAERQPVTRDSTAERQPLTRDSTAERQPVTRDSAQERQPVTRDSTAERQPVTRDSTAERQPFTRDSTAERQPLTRDSTAERQPVTRDSVQERQPVTRDTTAERQPVTRDSTAERQPVTRDSTAERQPVTRADRRGDRSRGGDSPSAEIKEETSPAVDIAVKWGAVMQRQPWGSPSAGSPLRASPYSPSQCVMGHRFAFQYPQGFPPTLSGSPPGSPCCPFIVPSWMAPPNRFSPTFSGLHPQLWQQVIPPPWYLPTHPSSMGL